MNDNLLHALSLEAEYATNYGDPDVARLLRATVNYVAKSQKANEQLRLCNAGRSILHEQVEHLTEELDRLRSLTKRQERELLSVRNSLAVTERGIDTRKAQEGL